MTYADQIYTEAQATNNTEDLALENHYTTAILESEEDATTSNTITHQDLKTEVQQWKKLKN